MGTGGQVLGGNSMRSLGVEREIIEVVGRINEEMRLADEFAGPTTVVFNMLDEEVPR